MLRSNRPRVLGLVIMNAATSVSRTFSSASRSTRPSGLLATVVTSNPASRTDAGLVPWAASGMTTRRRGSLRASWWARMISSPVSSPWAPAAGWKVAAASPVSSHRACSRRASSSSAPCTCSAGWAGCSRANPGRAAAVSATFGLYFMVQDPSG